MTDTLRSSDMYNRAAEQSPPLSARQQKGREGNLHLPSRELETYADYYLQ